MLKKSAKIPTPLQPNRMGCSSSNTKNVAKTELVSKEVLRADSNIKVPDREKCNQLFDDVDQDNSGVIDKSELTKLLEALDLNASPSFVQSIMSIVDDNNTGKLSKKEFAQVVYILSNIGEECTVPRIMFLNADKDFSGTIDLKEFKYIANQTGFCTNEAQQEAIFKQLCNPPDNFVKYNVFIAAITKFIK